MCLTMFIPTKRIGFQAVGLDAGRAVLVPGAQAWLTTMPGHNAA
jgi:hypothetical protein